MSLQCSQFVLVHCHGMCADSLSAICLMIIPGSPQCVRVVTQVVNTDDLTKILGERPFRSAELRNIDKVQRWYPGRLFCCIACHKRAA